MYCAVTLVILARIRETREFRYNPVKDLSDYESKVPAQPRNKTKMGKLICKYGRECFKEICDHGHQKGHTPMKGIKALLRRTKCPCKDCQSYYHSTGSKDCGKYNGNPDLLNKACYSCGGIGHLKKDCRVLARSKDVLITRKTKRVQAFYYISEQYGGQYSSFKNYAMLYQ